MVMVTGAKGQLATLILQALSDRDIPAIGGSRAAGDGQRYLDFDNSTSLDFMGISILVLVSAGYAEDDQVIACHQSVLEVAVRDGVHHVIYTSLTSAGDHLGFALAHRATEKLVKASGLGWTILRNGLYAELFGALLTWTSDGLESAFGDGALSAVARADLATVAAIVASDPASHTGKTYDLVGAPITVKDVADRLGARHQKISLSEYRSQLLHDGTLLPFQPPMLTSIASSIRHGLLSNASPDLEQLLDRPITDALATAAGAVSAMTTSSH